MKGFLTLAVSACLAASLCTAAPCINGSLASYIALAGGGCTIDGNTLFNFQTVSGTAGTTAIATADLLISPFGGSTSFGFTATTAKTAATGTLLESIFTYQISGNLYTGTSITLAGSSETGDGAVADVQNYCAGGTFGPSGVTGCSGLAGSLVALDGIQQTDQGTFGGVTLLSITDDFTLDGGLAGSASGGSFTNQFTAQSVAAIPEPLSLLLAGLGLALAAVIKRGQHE